MGKVVEMNQQEEQQKTFLTKEELDTLKHLSNEFQKLKANLGDLELRKHALFTELTRVKAVVDENELGLIQKYGPNAQINIQTGEVTLKEKSNDTV